MKVKSSPGEKLVLLLTLDPCHRWRSMYECDIANSFLKIRRCNKRQVNASDTMSSNSHNETNLTRMLSGSRFHNDSFSPTEKDSLLSRRERAVRSRLKIGAMIWVLTYQSCRMVCGVTREELKCSNFSLSLAHLSESP